MANLDLTPYLREKLAPYPRKIGRYNSSELYRIQKGWIKPEDWASPRHFSTKSMLAMWNGMIVHTFIQDLLSEGESEVKKIYLHETPQFELVAKADFVPHNDDEVWDIKTSQKELNKARPEHLYQVQLYCTIHEKSKGIIYQPTQTEDGLYLKNLGEVERDDRWFLEEMKKLGEFHEEVQRLTNKLD